LGVSEYILERFDSRAFSREGVVRRSIRLLQFDDYIFQGPTCIFESGEIVTPASPEGQLRSAITIATFLGGFVEWFASCFPFLRNERLVIG